MRKIINGMVFDTDTARCLFDNIVQDGFPDGVALYRSKSGNYFTLHYEFDDYKENSDSIITPLSRKKAMVCALFECGSEEARKMFDKRDQGTKQVNLRLPIWAYDILRETAADRGVSMAQVVIDMIDAGGENDDSIWSPDYEDLLMYESYLSLSEDELMAKFKEKEAQDAELMEMVKQFVAEKKTEESHGQ